MRIAINTLSVTDENEGIRTVLLGLVGALVRVDEVNRYRLIVSEANRRYFDAIVDRVVMTVVGEKRRRPLVRILHDQTTVPWSARHDTDLLLSLSSVATLFSPVPQVVLLPAHLALPSVRNEAGGATLSAFHRFYYGPLMRLSHRRADAVTPISRFLADRLVADTGLPARKVHAIPLGIDPVPPRPSLPEDDRPYVLFVSTLYPYKNADAVVRALALARPRVPADLRAVIVGRDPDGAQAPMLRRLAADLGVDDHVTVAGKVPDEQRDRPYDGATAVVFPSRAEGFGFPVLEAMARGVPVIASNRMSIPEVVGGAGLLVEPDRPEELADAIVRVIGDAALRGHLVATLTAGRKSSKVAIAMSVLLVAGVLVSGSRAAFFGLLVAVVAFFMVMRSTRTVLRSVAFCMPLVLAVLLGFVELPGANAFNRLFRGDRGTEISNQERTELRVQAVEQIRERPIQGSGFEKRPYRPLAVPAALGVCRAGRIGGPSGTRRRHDQDAHGGGEESRSSCRGHGCNVSGSSR